jgi:ferric-dicitrate binding protein FerR (iron transport regulator)
MDITKFRKQLKRYLNDTANETESAVIEAWYRSYQVDEKAKLNAENREDIKNAIQKKINSAIGAPVKLKWYNYRIAASLFLVCAASLFAYRFFKAKQSLPETFTTLQTREGEVKQIILPDSSVMWINALSRIRVPATFNGSIRKVFLDEGEAFFKVKRNVSKPFRVYTKALQVQVLGTSFNINAYNKLLHIKVAVATGKVAVSQGSRRLSLLTPGQELTFEHKNGSFSQQRVDASESQSWKDGDTYLNQVSFSELALVVKNLYGLKLKAANKQVNQYQFTLRLQRHMPSTEALKVISLIHNTHFRKEGNEVILY